MRPHSPKAMQAAQPPMRLAPDIRRDTVFQQMLREGFTDAAEYFHQRWACYNEYVRNYIFKAWSRRL